MFRFNKTFTDIVLHDLKSKVKNIPALIGDVGIGKSSWVEKSLAPALHTKAFILACNQLADKADLTGARLVPVTDNNGTVITYEQVFYPHEVINRAILYAKEHPKETPILFLDEINRTTTDVTSALLSIPTLRRIGSIDLPSNLLVIIAGNDKGNITSLDEASITRFSFYNVGPDTETFLTLDANLNPMIRSVLTQHKDVLFCRKMLTSTATDDDGEDIDAFEIDELIDGQSFDQLTTPRTISALSRWLNSFTTKELLTLMSETTQRDGEDIPVLQEAIEGKVGRTQFTAYLMVEIVNTLQNSANAVTSAINIAKPLCYDDMKKCQSLTDLEDFIDSMTDNDKSGCLVYALYEDKDNENYIIALAQNISSLTKQDSTALVQLANNDSLNEANVSVLMSTDTPVKKTFAIFLD